MWATVMYSQATHHPTAASLRRIARCYKSWINDRDTAVVNKLVALLLEKHTQKVIHIDQKTHDALLSNRNKTSKKRNPSET